MMNSTSWNAIAIWSDVPSASGFCNIPLRAAGVGVAQDALAETQSAILPLVPYLDTLRWVFIAVALIGIAVAIHARIDDWKRGQR